MSGEEAPAIDVLKGLPHAEPFRFLDTVTSVQRNRGAGIWKVRGDEDFLRGHFPDQPLVPGVLIAEAAAQLSGVVANARIGCDGSKGKLALSEAHFKKSIVPPADIELTVEGEQVIGSIHIFEFTAMCRGELCAHGRIGLSLEDES